MTTHHTLQLQAKGRLVRMEWDPKAGRHIERAVDTDELAWHLHDSVCFASGTTLRDLLMLVARDTDLFSTVAACDCLGELLAELGKASESTDEIAALEIFWNAAVAPAGSLPVLDSSAELCGHSGEGQVAIEFMPVNRLADLPILLNEAFNVRDDNDALVFSAAKRFSLLTVIGGVLDELTFLGTPSERDEALGDLRSRMDSFDEEKCFTIEEVVAEMERRTAEDKAKFPCRLCGADNRCACFGKPGDLCHDCFHKMREN